MSVPHYGDRPVAGWRYDPDGRDALSYTLGLYRRVRPVAARAPRPRRVIDAPAPSATTQLSLLLGVA